MPTPESSTAFRNLVDARERLSDLSKQLKQFMGDRGLLIGDERYRALQAEWSEAFKAFQAAVREFSDVVQRLDGAIEERRVQDEARHESE